MKSFTSKYRKNNIAKFRKDHSFSILALFRNIHIKFMFNDTSYIIIRKQDLNEMRKIVANFKTFGLLTKESKFKSYIRIRLYRIK